MERLPEKANESDFYQRLLNEGLVSEVRPGLAINESDYTFVNGEEFTVQDVINKLTGYLSTPTLIDSFSSHEKERVPAFNDSGVLDSELNKRLYLSNRLRLNKISGTLGTLRVTTKVRELPESFRSFIGSKIDSLGTDNYNSLTTEEKIAFTEKLANTCVAILNQAVTEGIIAGPTI